jgi:hypothetical protein
METPRREPRRWDGPSKRDLEIGRTFTLEIVAGGSWVPDLRGKRRYAGEAVVRLDTLTRQGHMARVLRGDGPVTETNYSEVVDMTNHHEVVQDFSDRMGAEYRRPSASAASIEEHDQGLNIKAALDQRRRGS